MESRKNKRSGFTLIELLLVVAIIGVLGTIAVVQFGDVGTDSKIAATKASIQAIDQAVTIFRTKVGRLPKNLEELTQGINDDEPLLKAGALNDSWGNPFDFKAERKKYTIRSSGADEQMNTEDDLTT